MNVDWPGLVLPGIVLASSAVWGVIWLFSRGPGR